MKWTTTQLVAAGAMGALLALAFSSEGLFNVIIGIPGAGGIVGSFFEITIFSFAILLLSRFGAATLVGGIASFIILPLPVFGPPGFFVKVLVAVGVGLIYDFMYIYFKRFGKWGLVLINSLLILFADTAIGLAFLLFKLPGIEQLGFSTLLLFNLVFLVEGVAGSLVGWYLYQKLRNTAVVRRIQAK